MEYASLADLACGESAILMEMDVNGSTGRRLCELGFLAGTELTCVHIAPAGSPVAVRVRGTMISLRRDLCKKIRIRRRG